MTFDETSLAIGGWVVAGVLIMVGAAGYLYYSTKLHDLRQLNTALQHTAEQNTKTIQTLTAASHNADRILLEREKEIEQLKKQTQTTKTEIKEIYVKEPATKNWADTEIPRSIILQLQEKSAVVDGMSSGITHKHSVGNNALAMPVESENAADSGN